MKPLQDSNAIREWEMRFTRTSQEDDLIKKRMEEIWKKNYKKL